MATGEAFHRRFSDICRLCLKQDGVMAPIFRTLDAEDGDFSLAQRIATIARVQIHKGDGLPALICHQCRHQVEKSYNFRLLVEISDRALRNCLETVQAEKCEKQMTIKQECSGKNMAFANEEENINLEQFLLQNNLSNSDIDPSAINIILVQSEDGSQMLNICSVDVAKDTENLGDSGEIKDEYLSNTEKEDDPIACEVSEENESTLELDDLEGIRQLLSSENVHSLRSEPQVQRVYTCNVCHEIFLSNVRLNNHLLIAHGGDSEDVDVYKSSISCQLCFEVFATLADLKNHIIEHFNDGRNLDSIKTETNSGKVEKEVDNTDNIDNVRHGNYQYVLETSKDNASYSETPLHNSLEHEMMEHAPINSIFEITTDGSNTNGTREKFNSDNDLVALALNLGVNNDTDSTSDVFYCVEEYATDRVKSRPSGNFPCTQCDKTFTHKHEHTLHLRRHLGIKPFKCTFCDKAFITNALKKEHERSHTGDKVFVCLICGKSFIKKSELKYHEGIHTDAPSTCNICNKNFMNVQSLKMHMRRHVLGSRYVCETCGKSYYTNSELARHVQVHSGKREYPCHLCQTSFLSRPELNRHLNYHIGEKKFKCKICSKSYFESGHLRIHQRVHTGEKPYACTICNKAFVTKPKLARHAKIHAKERIGDCRTVANQQREVKDTKTIL